MAQEITVLKCASCETFQSQIVKKTRKWECKVCGTKQSIKKVYGRGSGKDCRLHTQKLNAFKGEGTKNNQYEIFKECFEVQNSEMTDGKNLPVSFETELGNFSKWAKYTDEEQFSVNKEWNLNEHNIGTKITNPLCGRKRKCTSDQSSNKKHLNHQHLHLSFQGEKIQTKNKMCSQTTNKSIVLHNETINTQPKKKNQAQTFNVNRGKYLKVKGYEELKSKSIVPSLNLFPTKPSDFLNSEPNTDIKSVAVENQSNIQTPGRSMTFDANHSFLGLSNQMLKHVSKDEQSLSDIQYFDKNTAITPEQQSSKQLLVSSQHFELNSNLTDFDFQLEF